MTRIFWLAVALAACSAPAPREFQAPLVVTHSLSGDVHVMRVGTPRPRASGTTTTIYLNYEGVSLSQAADDYAPSDQSGIGGTVVPSYQPPMGARFNRQQGMDAITDRFRWFFRPYDVQVVTAPPSSGDYTMVAIGGSHTILPNENGAAGVSILDCDNVNPDNVVFDFSDDLTPDYGGLPFTAIDAAHESGHSFGLEHTDNPSDIMYSVASPNVTIDTIFGDGFTTGNYSSFNATGVGVARCPSRGTALDNHQLLIDVLGANPAPGDTVLPTVSFDFPILPQVPGASFQAKFTASDNDVLVRLELYKNLELIQVLTAPPFTTTVPVISGEKPFYLTIEAIDRSGNRSRLTEPFIPDSTTPSLCPNGDSDCATGQKCQTGICRFPLGMACNSSNVIQCLNNQCKKPAGTASYVCTQSCSSVKACPDGFTCGTDSLCVMAVAPTPKSNGEACATGDECMSGRCQDVCVAACDPTASACDPGLVCMPVTGGDACVLPSPMPMGNNKSGGCSLTPDASPSLPLLLLLAAITGRSRRRRAG